MFEKGHGRRERQSGRGRGGRRESPAGSRPPYYYPLYSLVGAALPGMRSSHSTDSVGRGRRPSAYPCHHPNQPLTRGMLARAQILIWRRRVRPRGPCRGASQPPPRCHRPRRTAGLSNRAAPDEERGRTHRQTRKRPVLGSRSLLQPNGSPLAEVNHVPCVHVALVEEGRAHLLDRAGEVCASRGPEQRLIGIQLPELVRRFARFRRAMSVYQQL